VTFVPRKGVRVSEVSLADAAELYLCRGYLAGLAARLATEYATPEEIAALRTLQGVAEEALAADDREQYVRRAFEFDELLIEMARNQLLTQLLARLQRGSLRLSISLSMPVEVVRASMQTRRELLQAIDAREAAEAERLMRWMVSLTWDALAEAGLGSGDAGGARLATGELLRDT
jgi:DNA-binding GntR family transcriptional regulator